MWGGGRGRFLFFFFIFFFFLSSSFNHKSSPYGVSLSFTFVICEFVSLQHEVKTIQTELLILKTCRSVYGRSIICLVHIDAFRSKHKIPLVYGVLRPVGREVTDAQRATEGKTDKTKTTHTKKPKHTNKLNNKNYILHILLRSYLLADERQG